MSIKIYEEYKGTPVRWINKIPKHWDLLPTKRAFRRKKETNAGMKVDNRLALTMKGVVKRSLDDLEGLQASEYENYQIFKEGDLSFKLIDIQNIKTSRVGIVPEEGIMSPAYIRLSRTGRIEPKYAYWYFMKLYHECIFNELGGGVRQTIGPEELLSLPLTYPPKGEQLAIASFLDHETAKIDALITEHERLIELLQEKRQAVISHAVTKGLNPNVLMKNSGVDWLGEVPEHWETPSLGVLIERGELGENHNSSEGNNGVPVIKMGNLGRGSIRLEKVEFLPEDIHVEDASLLNHGDFLFNTRNSLDLVGKVAIWRDELPIATYNSNILRIRFNTLKISSTEYVSYFFNSRLGLSQLRILAKGTTSVAAIYYKDLTSFRIFLPPLAEQLAIAKHLDSACTTLDNLIFKSESSVQLLQERRSALISAAVTGQIDVRDLSAGEEIA